MNGVAVLLVIGCIAMPTLACADGWTGWRGSGGWGADSPYERCYDPTNMDTFSGEVTSVDTVIPMPGMAEGMHLPALDTGNNQRPRASRGRRGTSSGWTGESGSGIGLTSRARRLSRPVCRP
jgi:hypothetical protein